LFILVIAFYRVSTTDYCELTIDYRKLSWLSPSCCCGCSFWF